MEPFDDDMIWNALSAYSDGEATPEEVAQVEAMLRSNPSFANELSFLQMSGESARDFIEVEPPARMTDAILSKTSHRITFAKRIQNWVSDRTTVLLPVTYRYGFAGSAAALLIVCGVALYRNANVRTSINSNSQVIVSALPHVEPTVETRKPEVELRSQSNGKLNSTALIVKTNLGKKSSIVDVKPQSAFKVSLVDHSRVAANSIPQSGKPKRTEAHPVARALQIASSALQPAKGSITIPTAEKQIIVSEAPAEESLGANVDSHSDTVATTESPAIFRESEQRRPRITLASLSERANYSAPPSDAFRSSLDQANKKQFSDDLKELKEQSIAAATSSRQFKARIINGSF